MPNAKKAPCPCGSGRPFDECCGRRTQTSAKIKVIGVWGGILVVTGVVTAVALSRPGGVEPPPITTRTPQPWEYDPVTNQHWDPRPGHQHWHVGPPPADPTATIQDTGGQAPQPYEYDAVNDRYWDPRPGHQHWHSGRPTEH